MSHELWDEPEPWEANPRVERFRRWLEHCMGRLVYDATKIGPSKELVAEMIAWYTERVEQFVDPVFGQPIRALVTEEIEVAQREASQRLALKREASEYPTLDEWLAHVGASKWALKVGPKEPQAGRLLTFKKWRGLLESRTRFLQHWPRVCRECGADFRDAPRNAVRCGECRAGRSGTAGGQAPRRAVH